LVNFTNIDWFLPWPNEALHSTATYAVQDMELHGENIPKIKRGLVDVCVDM